MPEVTRSRAEALVEGVADHEVCWVSGSARQHLGRGFAAVVVDLHRHLDADLLGQCHGLVRGGGVLMLRLPESCPAQEALAVHPYGPADVTGRFFARLVDAVREAPSRLEGPVTVEPTRGTEEQAGVVDALVALLERDEPVRVALTADRGRGKSAALGLALRRLGHTACALTGPSPVAVAEVSRFWGEHGVPWIDPVELAGGSAHRVVVVDEAAGLSLALLRRLVASHPSAHLVFASTVHGYEGTGRGFVLRFLPELAPVHLTLRTPIRWAVDDPLEAWAMALLALDAEPPVLGPARDPEPVCLDRDLLARDEALLRGVFGLLVHAHYRTTPSDLHRLLDAPNLSVHAVLEDGLPVAVALVAHEGGLPGDLCTRIVHGHTRPRGHALVDTLICHADRADAGSLSMVRSVRTVVHPERRGRGLARLLVDHVHATHDAELYGTLFGATAQLVRFRRAVGYTVVRVGSARSARTGEPGVVMVRPASAAARALVSDLRGDLARELPVQLALLEADGLALDGELVDELTRDLPPPRVLDRDACLARARGYTHGARPYEAAAWAIETLVAGDPTLGGRLAGQGARLVHRRVVGRVGWRALAAEEGMTVRATMRALRRALAGGLFR